MSKSQISREHIGDGVLLMWLMVIDLSFNIHSKTVCPVVSSPHSWVTSSLLSSCADDIVCRHAW